MNCHACSIPKTPGSHSKRPRADNHRATSITGLVFQDDLTLISCGECDGNIKVWDLRKNYNIYKREPLPKHSIPYCGSSTKNGYTNLIIDNVGIRLYASCMDNVIYCFNIATYNTIPIQRYIGHENSTFYIKTSLSPDCKYLVSGSSDKNAYIWNVTCFEPLVKLTGHWAEVTCAAWCQTGDIKIVTCSDDARHKIWRIGKEFLNKGEEQEQKGQAEVVPHTEIINLPQWGTFEQTPKSLKRGKVTTPNSYGAKRSRRESISIKKIKRCLTDMLNGSKDPEDESTPVVKRLKTDLPSIIESETDLWSAGIKRISDNIITETTPTKRKCSHDKENSEEEKCIYTSPKAGTSFMTPTKNYEVRQCRKLSPKMLPIKMSPESPKVRIVPFITPTKNLPNYVLTGEAPHLSLMSPVKKKLETTNWLTQISKERQSKNIDETPNILNLANNRKPSADKTDKIPKSTAKTRSLLKYFQVTSKDK